MEIKIELPEIQEDKKIIENLDLMKLVFPTMVNHIKDFDFLKDIVYGGKKV